MQTFKEKMEIFSQWNEKFGEKSNVEFQLVENNKWRNIEQNRSISLFALDCCTFRLKPQVIYINAYKDGLMGIFNNLQECRANVILASKTLAHQFKATEITSENNNANYKRTDKWRAAHSANHIAIFNNSDSDIIYKNENVIEDYKYYSLEIIHEKPEKEYRAFKDIQELKKHRNKWLAWKANGTLFQIDAISPENSKLLINSQWIDLKQAFEDYTFEKNGLPFGIEI